MLLRMRAALLTVGIALAALALREEHRGGAGGALLLLLLVLHVLEDLGDDGHVFAPVVQRACKERGLVQTDTLVYTKVSKHFNTGSAKFQVARR